VGVGGVGLFLLWLCFGVLLFFELCLFGCLVASLGMLCFAGCGCGSMLSVLVVGWAEGRASGVIYTRLLETDE
jgi:hypothetical protein